mgnify:CR=1 FL=1
MFSKYLYYYLLSPLFRGNFDSVTTTTINQITQTNLKNRIVPLPPLAEQKRIVEKLDKLLSEINSTKVAVKKADFSKTETDLLNAQKVIDSLKDEYQVKNKSIFQENLNNIKKLLTFMLENGTIVELAERTAGNTQTVNHITTKSFEKS